MEEKIFRLPAVSGLLQEHFVEARLHNDDHGHPDVMLRVQKLQDELAGTRATPHYLILEPGSRRTLDVFEGPDLFSGGAKFGEFLRKALP